MVKFDKDTHTYTLDGKVLISTTQLLSKFGLAPSYEGAKTDILEKAAEKGTLIHKEIEDYIKSREIGFTEELGLFIDFCKNNAPSDLKSEIMVNNEHIAGTIDFIYTKDGKRYIADFKTTSVIHKNTVAWQLSIYTYLYDKENYESTTIQCFHFKNGELNIVELSKVPVNEVEKLISCYVDGKEFTENDDVIPLYLSTELNELETALVKFEKEIADYKAKEKEILEKIKSVMEESGITKCTCGKVVISYVGESVKTTIDSARLKKELPEIAEQYSKQTKTSAYIKIKIKEE